MKRVYIYGFGNIGRELITYISGNKNLVISAVGDSKASLYSPSGFSISEIDKIIGLKKGKGSLDGLHLDGITQNEAMHHYWSDSGIFVDSTGASSMGAILARAIEGGAYVVTCNKLPLVSDDKSARTIISSALDGRASIRGTVGADMGIPDALIHELNSVHDISSIEIRCCPSGTLNYVCTAMQEGRKFSEAFNEAIDFGYTEPRPSMDASGSDVLNKAIIMARLVASHKKIDYSQISVRHTTFFHGIADERFAKESIEYSRDDYKKITPSLDAPFSKRLSNLNGSVLRYVASVVYDGRNIQVTTGLENVNSEDMLARLRGTENAFSIMVNDNALFFPAGKGGNSKGAGIGETAHALYTGIERFAG
ncbi:hypothetical protein J4401_02775 [Candidatus Woesearchaeota archaeon]|nr:hypothetical protein [Candidatus Woesearchaeota archaeon]